jgi:hypothetical protein
LSSTAVCVPIIGHALRGLAKLNGLFIISV